MQKTFSISTSRKDEMIDITDQLSKLVERVDEGICHVYVKHATAAIIVNENADPDICLDLLDALDNQYPQGAWRHDRLDGNAASHIKASILGPGECIPVKDGKLLLGRWQAPMLVELDGPKKRTVVVTIR